MTPPASKTWKPTSRSVAALGISLGLVLYILGPTTGGGRAFAAAPDQAGVARPVTLRLDAETATRLALAEEGAAQESDTEKPRPMDEPKVTVTKVKGDGSDAEA